MNFSSSKLQNVRTLIYWKIFNTKITSVFISPMQLHVHMTIVQLMNGKRYWFYRFILRRILSTCFSDSGAHHCLRILVHRCTGFVFRQVLNTTVKRALSERMKIFFLKKEAGFTHYWPKKNIDKMRVKIWLSGLKT